MNQKWNLEKQARVAWIGVGAAIASMVALIVFGLVSGNTQVIIIATSQIGAAVGIGFAVRATVQRKLAQGSK